MSKYCLTSRLARPSSGGVEQRVAAFAVHGLRVAGDVAVGLVEVELQLARHGAEQPDLGRRFHMEALLDGGQHGGAEQGHVGEADEQAGIVVLVHGAQEARRAREVGRAAEERLALPQVHAVALRHERQLVGFDGVAAVVGAPHRDLDIGVGADDVRAGEGARSVVGAFDGEGAAVQQIQQLDELVVRQVEVASDLVASAVAPKRAAGGLLAQRHGAVEEPGDGARRLGEHRRDVRERELLAVGEPLAAPHAADEVRDALHDVGALGADDLEVRRPRPIAVHDGCFQIDAALFLRFFSGFAALHELEQA